MKTLTLWVTVETIWLFRTKHCRFHGKCNQCSSGTTDFIRPFAFLLFLVPEELMRTLTNLISSRFTYMINVAILFIWVSSTYIKPVIVSRNTRILKNINYPSGFPEQNVEFDIVSLGNIVFGAPQCTDDSHPHSFFLSSHCNSPVHRTK